MKRATRRLRTASLTETVFPSRARQAPICFLGILLLLVLCGCAGRGALVAARNANRIRIVGSDTMIPLVQRWAEEFMRRMPGVSVSVEGGGTRVGVEALIDGKCEFGAASRSLTPEEISRLARRRGYLGICILCAKDALSIYLNPRNPVVDLTMPQLRDIFSGKVTSWEPVGGWAEEIHPLIREPNSGTRAFLGEHVLLGEPYSKNAVVVVGTRALADSVAADSQAVGFGGVAYGPNVRHCRIEGVEPNADNVRSGAYPLSRYLYLYTVAPPEGNLRRFVDFVLSPEGQRIVREVGYIPLLESP